VSAASASIAPKRMPISRLALRLWLGSSTSPPLMTRSNLSSDPIAAMAGGAPNPAAESASTEAEPASVKNSRREVAGMTVSSGMTSYWRLPGSVHLHVCTVNASLDGAGEGHAAHGRQWWAVRGANPRHL